MIWESTILKEYIIINAMAVKPMKKSIRTENINGSALDKWMLNMNCLYLTIYMTKNAGNVRGCSESKENDMWRREYEEYKCPWKDWEKCLKGECPFYDEMEKSTSEGRKKYHRCTRALNESKGE